MGAIGSRPTSMAGPGRPSGICLRCFSAGQSRRPLPRTGQGASLVPRAKTERHLGIAGRQYLGKASHDAHGVRMAALAVRVSARDGRRFRGRGALGGGLGSWRQFRRLPADKAIRAPAGEGRRCRKMRDEGADYTPVICTFMVGLSRRPTDWISANSRKTQRKDRIEPRLLHQGPSMDQEGDGCSVGLFGLLAEVVDGKGQPLRDLHGRLPSESHPC